MTPEPSPAVGSWLNDQAAETLYLSSVTLAEPLSPRCRAAILAQPLRIDHEARQTSPWTSVAEHLIHAARGEHTFGHGIQFSDRGAANAHQGCTGKFAEATGQ